jgi:uncharacterized membrane protein
MQRASTRPPALALIALLIGALGVAACQPNVPIAVPAIKAPATAKATCTTTSTRSIVVAASIVNRTRQLLAAAKADGLKLCGGGYRNASSTGPGRGERSPSANVGRP